MSLMSAYALVPAWRASEALSAASGGSGKAGVRLTVDAISSNG
jgi:hypothetical protein